MTSKIVLESTDFFNYFAPVFLLLTTLIKCRWKQHGQGQQAEDTISLHLQESKCIE